MTASLTTIVGLLSSALALLNLIHSHPELPQTTRDQFQQTAQNAVTQAVSLLATNNATTTLKVTPSATSSTSTNQKITLTKGKIDVTENSAHITWTTSIPANSKITITKSPANLNATTSQYLPSANGLSTNGLVSVTGLVQNTQYDYVIETTSLAPTIKLAGSFTTAKSAEQIAKEAADEAKKLWKDCPDWTGSFVEWNGNVYYNYGHNDSYNPSWTKILGPDSEYSHCVFQP
jgi:hypothetical protein